MFQKAVNFLLIYISYISFYLCRKNYSTFLPLLEENYDVTLNQAATLGSTFELFYGIFKLIAGPLSDNITDPKLLLSGSLLGSAIVNLLMFQSNSLMIDRILWCLNSFFQSLGWPALSAVFMQIFQDNKNRGTMYTILSTSQNVGSALTPILLHFLLYQMSYPWNVATTIVPGIISSVIAALLFLLLSTKRIERKSVSLSDLANKYRANFRKLLSNPNIRLLSLSYAFCTFVRVVVADWTVFYLRDTQQYSLSVMASFETGGFFGGLAIGVLSDKVFKGKRTTVMALFLGLAVVPIYAIFGEGYLSIDIAFCILGFFTFGPHVFFGLVAREVFPESPNTAGSFVKFMAQAGGVLSGYPVSLVIDHPSLGWQAIGWILGASCMCSCYCLTLTTEASPLIRQLEEKKSS